MRRFNAAVAMCILSFLGERPSLAAQQAACHDQWPAWDSTGASIVFVSTRTGDHEVYSLDLDSDRLVQLTAEPGRDAHPSVSPDRTRIAFQSPRGGSSTHLYTMDLSGAELRQVTAMEGFAGMPVWSPDGTRLAFQHRNGDLSPTWALKVVSLATGDITDLTEGTANDQVVNWSPDGKRLVFHSDRTGINQLYIWEGGVTRQLTHGPHEHRNGTWSPDGRLIAFASTREGARGIYVMNADGSGERRVGSVALEHGLPFFSPDGLRLLITPTTERGVRLALLDIEGGELVWLPGACDRPEGS